MHPRFLSQKCPHCGRKVRLHELYTASPPPPENLNEANDEFQKHIPISGGIPQAGILHYTLAACPVCAEPEIIVTDNPPGGGSKLFRYIYDARFTSAMPDGLPTPIAELWEDASAALNEAGRARPAVTAIRTLIEAAAKEALARQNDSPAEQGIPDADAQSGRNADSRNSSTKPLVALINKLCEEGLITKSLKAAADHLRLEGNLAVHDHTRHVTMDTARMAWRFANTLLEVLYAVPYHLEQLKAPNAGEEA